MQSLGRPTGDVTRMQFLHSNRGPFQNAWDLFVLVEWINTAGDFFSYSTNSHQYKKQLQQNFSIELLPHHEYIPLEAYLPNADHECARTQHCLAAVKFNGRDSYSESRILKVGIFSSLSAPVGSEGKRGALSSLRLSLIAHSL